MNDDDGDGGDDGDGDGDDAVYCSDTQKANH